MANSAPRKRKTGRIIAIVLAVLIVPLVIGYFVATSELFFKRVILPKVGASMNSSVTVSEASISPFSQVVLKNLEVKPFNKDPLLKASEVRARYSLWDIIRGKIMVHEATVVSPVITIVEAADNTSNLDPITQQTEADAEQKKKDEKASEAANLNIQNVSLKNATILSLKHLEGGGRESVEITDLNFSIDRLVNGQPGKLTVTGNVRMENVPSANSTNVTSGSMRGTLAGNFDYKLTGDAQPESAKGNLRFDVAEAKGEMADLAKLAAIVDCDLTPTEIRQLALRFEQNGNALGHVHASGPFSFANTEGKLKLVVSSIDRRVLNLVGATSGFDFNSTVISSENDIAISQSGNAISIEGQLKANQLSLTQKAEKQTTPTMNIQAAYQLSVDQNAESALVRKFDLNGTQNQQKFLSATLSKPMPISWGGDSSAPENASLKLAITNLNLADWKSFAGELAPSGTLNANVDLVSQQAGKQLALNVSSRINDFSATFASNQVSKADVELTAKANIAEMKKVSLENYSVKLSQNNQDALTLTGSGTVDLAKNDSDIKAAMQGSLAPLFKIVQVPDLTATSGIVKFDGQITRSVAMQTLKGNFALTNFSGTYEGSPLDRFGATFDADIAMNEQTLRINKASGALQQAGRGGGTFDVSGNLNSQTGSGQFELKISDVNQNALRPFLAESLGEKQLVTISVNGNATAFLQEKSSSVRGNFEVKNFVVRDPKKGQPDAPLSAQLQLDGAKRDEVFDLKQFQVTLSPTQRAKNQLNITGQLDLSKTNAAKGQLLVQSDSFDVTPFYDLYNPPEEQAASPTNPAPAASNEEPEPTELPVDRIVAEINIGQFYLREMEIKNWRGTAKIEGSRVLLNPFQFTLNNAPVSVNADLNLGVKGYAYDFTASLDGVPLEPLANSFIPEKRGAYKGTILANAKIKGAGMTGVNLKKTLAGQAGFTFTNANIQIVSEKWRPALVTIASVLRSPEIAESPLNWVDARLGFGNGNIVASNVVVVSEAFRASVQGSIPIADVLTNSPVRKIPVNFELRRSIAEKAPKEMNLMSGTASADGKYILLPRIFTLKGTLGKVDVDYYLKPLAVRAGVGLIGGEAGKILGGILGQPSQSNTNATNQASTNAPATNPPINQLLEGLLNRKKN